MLGRGIRRNEPAVQYHGQVRPIALQPVHVGVVQRRYLPILLRRQAAQDRGARMHHEGVDACIDHRGREFGEEGIVVACIDADAALHGHRQLHRIAHPPHAIGHQLGPQHEAGAERAAAHAIARAADIQVDLIVARRRPRARRGGELQRIAAAELQGERVFGRIMFEQAQRPPPHDRGGHDHLGVEQRVRGEQPVHEAAVAVGPIHHRGDAHSSIKGLDRFSVHQGIVSHQAPGPRLKTRTSSFRVQGRYTR